jgi:hypothetical protein
MILYTVQAYNYTRLRRLVGASSYYVTPRKKVAILPPLAAQWWGNSDLTYSLQTRQVHALRLSKSRNSTTNPSLICTWRVLEVSFFFFSL